MEMEISFAVIAAGTSHWDGTENGKQNGRNWWYTYEIRASHASPTLRKRRVDYTDV